MSSAERFDYCYTDGELEEWVPRIEEMAKRLQELHMLMRYVSSGPWQLDPFHGISVPSSQGNSRNHFLCLQLGNFFCAQAQDTPENILVVLAEERCGQTYRSRRR